MRGRLAAGTIALVILVTGVLPAFGGYRCIAMGVRMDAPSSCCRHTDTTSAVKAPCCEAVAAARVEPRRTPSSPETRIQPPVVVAWIAFPPSPPMLPSHDATARACARGRPPGEALHLLSSVLRV